MIIERLARAGVDRAARRWPADLSEVLREEWAAELAALRGHPGKMLAFAGSLLISPAVDEPSWSERATGAGRAASAAAGVTLLGAALFNGVHVSGRPVLFVAAAAVMAAVGARVRMPGVTLIGLALFAFLWMGNEVAVMPFMGVLDVAPAVLTWTLGSAAVLRLRRAPLAAAGTLATVVLATIAGSVHGAHVLGGVGADGLLWANASAMAGPMLLCSIFVLTAALRPPVPARTSALRPPASARTSALRPPVPARTSAPRPPASARTSALRPPVPARIVAGIGAALGSLAFCEWMNRTPRLDLDDSFAFGFGFAAHPAGSAAVALLVALLILQAVEKVADPM